MNCKCIKCAYRWTKLSIYLPCLHIALCEIGNNDGKIIENSVRKSTNGVSEALFFHQIHNVLIMSKGLVFDGGKF